MQTRFPRELHWSMAELVLREMSSLPDAGEGGGAGGERGGGD